MKWFELYPFSFCHISLKQSLCVSLGMMSVRTRMKSWKSWALVQSPWLFVFAAAAMTASVPRCLEFRGNFRLWGGLPNDAIISFDLPNGDKEAQQKLLQDVPKLTWTPLVSIFMDFFLGQLPSGWSLGRRTWALGCSGCYCERRASRPGICKEVCSNSWPFRQQEICLPWPDWSARWTNMPMPPRAGLECSKTAACQLHAVKVMLTFCEFARCFPSCVYAFPHNHFAGRPVQYTHLHAAFMALQLDF